MAYIPAVMHNGKKTFTVLENNPAVLTPLAHTLGLPPTLHFHDIYSLHPSELSHIPRPAHALLVILPLTESWHEERVTEDAPLAAYSGSGPSEPVLWFKQTIGHACGSIGVVHCAVNGSAAGYIEPGSFLARLKEAVTPMGMEERARYLYDSQEFEAAHQGVAGLGDTAAPSASEGDRLGQHFVAFVRGGDGHLWELEGGRKGPLDRGVLGEGEDVLSPRALGLGLGRLIALEAGSGGGDLRFSATVLA